MSFEEYVPKFDLRNEGLPFLAAEAAIAADNYLQGRSSETASIQYLGNLIEETTKGNSPRARLPDISSVLIYAISGRKNANVFWKGRTVDDVVVQANLLAKDLRGFRSLGKEQQRALGDFCCRLSEEAGRHYDEFFSPRSGLAAA